MTCSDHIRAISRIKNAAKINASYGDLSARIYYLMSCFPVAVSIYAMRYFPMVQSRVY